MKKEIHPEYFSKAKVSCACGNVFEVGSTQESLEVEICSACHPFYTGVDRVVDTAGRVEKFRTRASKAGSKKTPKAKTTTKVKKSPTAKAKKESKTS